MLGKLIWFGFKCTRGGKKSFKSPQNHAYIKKTQYILGYKSQ